ncbi:MAG TPA: polysaccharide pyruvyl transferase family protein, partial [Myxococcaceae bacterium]|nr:polysaccharide pyruvyl transferase family protein [Myxococcaceae bacterium]
MKKRNLEIGICGTFDVENYGDLLFPLIAEAELSSRLGAVTLHRFSYHSKAEPEWPFRVEALVDLPRAAQELDGMIIGGGDVVRFDKDVAPGYLPPSPGVHHPTGYWLAPALIASQSGLPVAWNAPGVVQEVPEWASPLVTAAVQASAYVSVRDRASQQKLLPFAGGKAIEVVPDSVFGIGRMVRERSPSSSAADLRKALGLNKPYLVVHAQGGSGAFLDWARAHHKALSRFQIVALPVGPVLGDSDAHLFDGVRNVVRLPKWPRPLTIAEMIRGAEGIVGASLHLAITAVALGVPAFRPALHSGGKYALLSDFEGVFSAPTDGDAAWFISKLGPKPISRQAEAAAQRTARHWDAIAECMGRAAEVSPVKRSVNELWQALPAAFENQGLREARISELSSQLQERGCELEERRREIATLEEGRRQSLERVGQLEREVEGREQRIAELTRALGEREEQLNGFRKSKSWRVTAPGRWAGRTLRRVAPRESGSVLNFERLSRQVMAAEPYRYAAATGAFARRDGLALVRSFPHDHYKTVQGYDGEKGYAYEAR